MQNEQPERKVFIGSAQASPNNFYLSIPYFFFDLLKAISKIAIALCMDA